MSSIASLGVLNGALSAGQVAKSISLEDVSITPSTSQQTITAGEGYDGIGTATVSAVALENKTVTPTDSQQVITAGEGYLGLGTVTVEASSGGTDTLNTILNTPYNAQSDIEFTMEDDNNAHKCYGFKAPLDLTLPNTITEVASEAFFGSGIKSVEGTGVLQVSVSAFERCPYLASVNFPNATNVGDMAFSNCASLTSVRLPSVQSLGDGAFYDTPITNIYLGYNGVVSVTSYNPLVGANCTLHVPAGQLASYEADAGWMEAISVASDNGYEITIAGDYA